MDLSLPHRFFLGISEGQYSHVPTFNLDFKNLRTWEFRKLIEDEVLEVSPNNIPRRYSDVPSSLLQVDRLQQLLSKYDS